MTARVEISLGFTRNLGDFNSMRVDIGVADDLRQGEKVDDAFNRVYEYVEGKLIEKVQEVEAELKSQTEGD